MNDSSSSANRTLTGPSPGPVRALFLDDALTELALLTSAVRLDRQHEREGRALTFA